MWFYYLCDKIVQHLRHDYLLVETKILWANIYICCILFCTRIHIHMKQRIPNLVRTLATQNFKPVPHIFFSLFLWSLIWCCFMIYLFDAGGWTRKTRWDCSWIMKFSSVSFCDVGLWLSMTICREVAMDLQRSFLRLRDQKEGEVVNFSQVFGSKTRKESARIRRSLDDLPIAAMPLRGHRYSQI